MLYLCLPNLTEAVTKSTIELASLASKTRTQVEYNMQNKTKIIVNKFTKYKITGKVCVYSKYLPNSVEPCRDPLT